MLQNNQVSSPLSVWVDPLAEHSTERERGSLKSKGALCLCAVRLSKSNQLFF